MLSVSSNLNVTDAFEGAQAHNTSRQAADAAKAAIIVSIVS